MLESDTTKNATHRLLWVIASIPMQLALGQLTGIALAVSLPAQNLAALMLVTIGNVAGVVAAGFMVERVLQQTFITRKFGSVAGTVAGGAIGALLVLMAPPLGYRGMLITVAGCIAGFHLSHWFPTRKVLRMHLPMRLFLSACAIVALGACVDTPTELERPAPAPQQSVTPSAGYTYVTAGENFSCGLRADQTIFCWGSNAKGQLLAPSGTFTHIDAAVFAEVACGIRTSGEIACWGDASNAIISPPAGSFKKITIGLVHGCALRTDDTVACWGNNSRGQATPSAGSFTEIAAGFEHTCALNAAGIITCWGWNGAGQLGVPSALGPFQDVSSSYATSCGLRTNGGLVCWGRGFGGVGGEAGPPSTGTWTQLASGSVGGCALDSNGEAACWSTQLAVRTPPSGPFVTIDQGTSHACTVNAAGEVTCWGESADGAMDPATPAGPYLVFTRNGAPVASYAASAGMDVVLTGQALTPAGEAATAYSWTIGQGATVIAGPIDGSSITYAFAAAGTYTATLTATLAAGGTLTKSVTITVSQPNIVFLNQAGVPVSSFTTKADVPLTVTGELRDAAGTDIGTNYIMEVRVGGVTGSTVVGPVAGNSITMTFPNTGNRVVVLTATTPNGTVVTRSANISVTVAPTATLIAPDVVERGQTFTISAVDPVPGSLLAAASGVPILYRFLCSPANSPVQEEPTHQCTAPNSSSMIVRVTVSQAGFGAVTLSKTVMIVAVTQPPTATFNATSSVVEGSPVSLSLTDATDEDVATLQYAFDCGDGYGVFTATATASCPTLDDGSMTVRGMVKDAAGKTSEYTATVVVANAAPTAVLGAPASVVEGSAFTLSLASASDPSSADAAAGFTYAFDCGSGYGAYGAAASASCSTSDNGTRNVRASIQDKDGATSEYSTSVTITNAVPVVAAFSGATIIAGETYSAAGSFSDVGADSWTATVDYGNGAASLSLTGNAFALSNLFATAGTFNVTVTVTDDDGGIGTASAVVVVNSAAEAAAAFVQTIAALQASGAIPAATAEDLSKTLAAASASLATKDNASGINQLGAFKNKVRAAENSKKISTETAAALTTMANRIIAGAR